ncbi:MAG: pentapeptide repeat-containing protein [Nostoc desertorum CM1-VF14]|nr:pentapeptide repeat-containing protein [Nostoc desertorum CM1-VF14]
MKFKIVATVALLACFGFAEQALGLNQLDLDQLKATNACPRCNLSGADLTQQNLTGVDLRGADLSGATLSQANLTNADLTGANLEGAVLNSVNLSGASLTGANLKSASLENADLSYAGFISADLEAANLKDAKLLFTNFRGANFRLTTQANGVVTSDKPYGWSLERQNSRECNEFKPENTLGTTCYTK